MSDKFLIFIILLIPELKSQNYANDVHFLHFTKDGRQDLTTKTLNRIDTTQRTIILIHGFFADSSIDIDTTKIGDTFLNQNNNFNVIFVDWGHLSFSSYPYLVYDGVPKVGRIIGEFIMQLHARGLSLRHVHLIGVSLGAHIAGYAGRQVQEDENNPEKTKIYRISALDAAGPLYWKILLLFENPLSLRASDADVVDCTHTNAGYFGTGDNIGTVDVFVNGGTNQKYCEVTNSTLRYLPAHLCYHSFAAIIYQVTVGTTNYKASKTRDTCEDVIVYGADFDGNATGVYYIDTEPDYPYKSRC